jgi:hypothetical protein
MLLKQELELATNKIMDLQSTIENHQQRAEELQRVIAHTPRKSEYGEPEDLYEELQNYKVLVRKYESEIENIK